MNGDDDKLLEQYLADDSELSRRYRDEAGDESPPAGIDDRLRAAARREVQAGPRRFAMLPAAWTRPLAAAAVIILALGVVLQVVEENKGVHFDEVESTATDSVPQKTGEAESAPKPEAEESRTFKYEHRSEPVEEAPARVPRRAPIGQSSEQRPTQGAAPDTSYGDTTSPPAPGTASDAQLLLDHVRRLVAQGEMQAARQFLAQYRHRFPGRPVPQDLLDLLERGTGSTD